MFAREHERLAQSETARAAKGAHIYKGGDLFKRAILKMFLEGNTALAAVEYSGLRDLVDVLNPCGLRDLVVEQHSHPQLKKCGQT